MIALLRTELTKGLRRTRSLVMLAALLLLPAVITLALNSGGRRPVRRAGGLMVLARSSGLLIPAAVLELMSGFLLVVIAATIAGDAVAGDAASGNLRYLLLRPLSRTKLLVAKAAVSGLLIWVVTILLTLSALLAGITFFGVHAVTVPAAGAATGGFQLSVGVLLSHTAVATAYVAFGFTALLALGTLFSTLTDTPAGAIGATVGVYVVSEILDGISDLGRIRYALPTHYLNSWQSLFTANQYSGDLLAGVIVQLAYLAVFGTLAITWFHRKDISS